MPIRPTRVKKHRRKKPGGGYTNVKSHIRTVITGGSGPTHKSLNVYKRQRKDMERKIKRMESRRQWKKYYTGQKTQIWMNPETTEQIKITKEHGYYGVFYESPSVGSHASYQHKRNALRMIGDFMKTGVMEGELKKNAYSIR